MNCNCKDMPFNAVCSLCNTKEYTIHDIVGLENSVKFLMKVNEDLEDENERLLSANKNLQDGFDDIYNDYLKVINFVEEYVDFANNGMANDSYLLRRALELLHFPEGGTYEKTKG